MRANYYLAEELVASQKNSAQSVPKWFSNFFFNFNFYDVSWSSCVSSHCVCSWFHFGGGEERELS